MNLIAYVRWPRIVLITTLCLCAHAVTANDTEYISRQEWPAIQRGIQVTQYTKLAGIADQFDRTPGSNIVIMHPGGEAGYTWATEIRNWFVALGIPARMIALRPGSDVPGSLGLRVEQQGFN